MRKCFETPHAVAKLIAETPRGCGVLSGDVRAANPAHPESGRKRQRDLGKEYRLRRNRIPWDYRDNRFWYREDFKRFCRSKMRKYELN